MKLPAALEPWRAWLVLFPPDMAPALGELLLQLHPAVGLLRPARRPVADQPAGLGDIVRRGHYHRLLATEWLMADDLPDEFLRRAASGELLFAGPAPDNHRQAQRSVALFDAGPGQLGEPRLAHLALFILLARRAQDSNVRFEWGVIQRPGLLHADTGLKGMQDLLGARTLASASDTNSDAWTKALDELDVPPTDCWLMAGPGARGPRQVGATVAVHRELLAYSLRVRVREGRQQRDINLALPDQNACIRLLRDPFIALARQDNQRRTKLRPSLKYPPRFAINGAYLAVGLVDRDIMLAHVPDKVSATPGRVRRHATASGDRVLGICVLKRHCGIVAADGDTLRFTKFPGKLFNDAGIICPRPERDQFAAVLGMGRWLPTFFFNGYLDSAHCERVLMLDTAQRLVSFECALEYSKRTEKNKVAPAAGFVPIADNVIGIDQFDGKLVFASASGGKIDFYAMAAHVRKPELIFTVRAEGKRLLFGEGTKWRANSKRALFAVERDDGAWWVGTAGEGKVIHVATGATVIGVARRDAGEHSVPCLLVLAKDRHVIALIGGDGHVDVVRSAPPIAQASYDAKGDNLAWISHADHRLTVKKLFAEKPLVEVIPKEADSVD